MSVDWREGFGCEGRRCGGLWGGDFDFDRSPKITKPVISQKSTFSPTIDRVENIEIGKHGHQNCTMSSWPPHAPICHLWMRDMHNIVHTVATIAKLPEKALKITLICDFNRVVLHQYCMYGFRDRESGLEKGRSWLCQWVGDLVAIQCREEEERGKCVFLPNEIGKNGDLGRLKTWDFSVKITIYLCPKSAKIPINL